MYLSNIGGGFIKNASEQAKLCYASLEDDDVPRRGVPRGFSFVIPLLAVGYILLAVVFLKLLRIIPDPPDSLDITTLLITFIMGIVTTAILPLVSSFRRLFARLDHLENDMRHIRTELRHIGDNLALNSRISRLEAILESKPKRR